jgi:hypothetical protein
MRALRPACLRRAPDRRERALGHPGRGDCGAAGSRPPKSCWRDPVLRLKRQNVPFLRPKRQDVPFLRLKRQDVEKAVDKMWNDCAYPCFLYTEIFTNISFYYCTAHSNTSLFAPAFGGSGACRTPIVKNPSGFEAFGGPAFRGGVGPATGSTVQTGGRLTLRGRSVVGGEVASQARAVRPGLPPGILSVRPQEASRVSQGGDPSRDGPSGRGKETCSQETGPRRARGKCGRRQSPAGTAARLGSSPSSGRCVSAGARYLFEGWSGRPSAFDARSRAGSGGVRSARPGRVVQVERFAHLTPPLFSL